MRIYLAARYSRREELQGIKVELEAMGHVVTSRWLVEDHRGDTPERCRRFAEDDVDDVLDSQCVISFTELPRTATRGGRHVEFGIGFAVGARLIVVGPREHVFHFLPEVRHFASWDEAREAFR